jgi:hypothetical protein
VIPPCVLQAVDRPQLSRIEEDGAAPAPVRLGCNHQSPRRPT